MISIKMQEQFERSCIQNNLLKLLSIIDEDKSMFRIFDIANFKKQWALIEF